MTACTPNPTGAEVPWEPFKDCTEECAAPVPCPTCGRDLPPIGRSVPMEHYIASCCETARYRPINTRHIWDVSELAARRSVGINEPRNEEKS